MLEGVAAAGVMEATAVAVVGSGAAGAGAGAAGADVADVTGVAAEETCLPL